MAFQPVPNVASFKVVMRSNSQAVEINNVLYARAPGDWTTPADLVAVGDAIAVQWGSSVMPLMSSDAVLDRVECRAEDAEFGPEYNAEANVTGGVVGTPLSALMCMLVQIDCIDSVAPRGGRLFLSPFSEAQIARDLWDNTLLTDMQTAIQDVDTAMRSAITGCVPVRISRYSKTANPTPPHKRTSGTNSEIGSYETRALVATQRDRRTGIGP